MSMTPFLTSPRAWAASGLALLVCLSVPGSATFAQSSDDCSLFRTWSIDAIPQSTSAEPVSRAARLRLFRIAPGYLSDPIGLVDDDNLPGQPGTNTPAALAQPDSGPDWIQFTLGSDNPFLDLRRPGDPGGVGFYRVNTQVQLVGSPTTACTLGFQTVTPAGTQFAGVPDGPTVVSPAFSVFHALTENTAIQGFVGKNIAVSNASDSHPLQRNVQYGLAVQRPVVADGPDGLRNLFVSVGALGQARPEHDNFKVLSTWDVLPGLHWHVNDNWWLSSGMLLPIGPTHPTPGQWQITCSFQF